MTLRLLKVGIALAAVTLPLAACVIAGPGRRPPPPVVYRPAPPPAVIIRP